jgi:hypothetical protein
MRFIDPNTKEFDIRSQSSGRSKANSIDYNPSQFDEPTSNNANSNVNNIGVNVNVNGNGGNVHANVNVVRRVSMASNQPIEMQPMSSTRTNNANANANANNNMNSATLVSSSSPSPLLPDGDARGHARTAATPATTITTAGDAASVGEGRGVSITNDT